MLEHKSVFGNQVFEFHRIYRVNLMDEIRSKEQSDEKTRCETSSSSSALPSQMTPDHAHRRNSSSFLFRNSVCGGLPVSGSSPEFIPPSDSSLKGKSVHHAPVSFRNCASPKNSVVSESRPTKLRKMIDLELPAEEYTDTGELEQCGYSMASDTEEKLFPSQHEKTKIHGFHLESDSCLRRPYALADLNEPLMDEETTADPSVDVSRVHKQDHLTVVPSSREDVSRKPRQWNMNVTLVSSSYNDKGNGQNWLSSALKAEGTKDNGKVVHQTKNSELPFRPVQLQVFENHQQPRIFPPHRVREDPLLAKANNDFIMHEKSRSLPSFNNPGALVASHQPYASSSNLLNSWNLSWDKSSNYLSQKPMSVQMGPFFHSDSLSKSSQSAAQSNSFLGTWWHRHADPRSIPDSRCEPPVQNNFYHGSSSGRCKELPGRDYVVGSCKDNAITGSSSFLKVRNCFDLNSTGDLNLNVVPDDFSNESPTPQGAVKQEDPVSVLPWLRVKASNNEAARARNSPHIPESGPFHDQREVRNALDHQSCLTSTSSNLDARREKGQVMSEYPIGTKMILGVPIFQAPLSGEQEIDSGKKKVLFDINVPFDDPEEFVHTAAANEAILVEKTENEHRNCFRNMIDLNSCLTEEEVPSRTSLTNSSTTANSLKKPERCIIDLEAPVDVEAEEEGNSLPDEDSLTKQDQLHLHRVVQDSTDSSNEKLARLAAEVIVTIAASAPESHIMIPEVAEEASASGDALRWFVDIIWPSLDPEDVGACPDDDDKEDCWLSNDSDSFEEMTLNLSECTLEECFPDPPNLDILAAVDTEAASITTAQTRRTRRGRQRRDFQRDILPGLTSLARHEITEDLQTFTGLMRATGYAWNCGGRRNSSRNGSRRGRRRAVVAAPPVNDTCFASQKQNPKYGEITLEDGSLTSWGKTTRRPRRQRCPPSSR